MSATEAPSDRYALPELVTVVPHLPEARSLAEKAYYLLRDQIISLQLTPGTALDEKALMAELELGRTPIREALRRLADERLVEVAPRRGMFVTHIDIRDLAAIGEVRAELEGRAGQLAAERATDDERARASDLVGLVEATAGAGSKVLMRADQQVHRLVHAATHNPYLAATLEEYYVLALRLWFLVLDQLSGLDHAVAEHRELLTAVRDGDGDRAESVLRAHVQGFEQAIRAAL